MLRIPGLGSLNQGKDPASLFADTSPPPGMAMEEGLESEGSLSVALTSHPQRPVCNQLEIIHWTKVFFITLTPRVAKT